MVYDGIFLQKTGTFDAVDAKTAADRIYGLFQIPFFFWREALQTGSSRQKLSSDIFPTRSPISRRGVISQASFKSLQAHSKSCDVESVGSFKVI